MKPGAFDRSLCIACGKCAKVCAYGARELFGYEDTVENVMRTVMEDRIFYETSGGGMTISGGEPFYQPEFTLALLQAAKEQGLDTAVETNLFTSRAWPEAAAPLTDLFYVDVKLIDPDKHRRWCGAPNRVILEHIAFLSGLGARIIFRTPLIPGVNDTEIAGIGEFVLSLPERHPVEILKYHRIGAGKYASLGMDYSLDAEPADPEPARETLRKMGVEVIGE
jgi:pyruvate formate lyase activating enzyme